MKGIRFVIDENGEKTAVLIDLKEHSELWEDFYDACVAHEREREPRESIEEVRQRRQAKEVETVASDRCDVPSERDAPPFEDPVNAW